MLFILNQYARTPIEDRKIVSYKLKHKKFKTPEGKDVYLNFTVVGRHCALLEEGTVCLSHDTGTKREWQERTGFTWEEIEEQFEIVPL